MDVTRYFKIVTCFFKQPLQKGRKGKRENSGAYKCHKYARELGVQIINIADEIHNKKQ